MTVEEITRFQQEIYDELTGNILPFWMNKAGFWKRPYYNTRACLEVLSRSKRITCLPEQ